ncbi:hypothetical protein [Nitrosopumilus sp.]|uniref:hypothetical protein n=1 Tax=Nitrosopumilus sp. TaxID=2024843 RepID=UPI0026306B02|nr:hypothetical protein [Nitrosopumilus sp.]
MKSISVFAIILGIVLISGTLPSQSFADVISPRQQMKLDFTNDQIICAEGLVKVTKNTSDKVSCVKPSTAEKLADNGWAKPLSEKKLEEIQSKKLKKGEVAGTITKIATLKQLSEKTTGAKSSTNAYSYIFEACGTTKLVKAPEIFVTSDSETKSVKLASPLKPSSCYTSSVNIKAADPNSISAVLLNKGGISEKVSTLESQIADLKTKISDAKAKLPKSNSDSPDSENITNIVSMKKDLKELQDQLRRYLMVLYVPPNTKVSKLDLPKSITGQPLEGMSTNLISVTESVAPTGSSNADLKRFNVVFEACAGTQSIRLPVITVTSDTESVDVKLINRIIPESCQVGITRINALDSESIMPTISGNSGVSKQIKSLETQISEMEAALADKRSNLGDLISKKLDSSTEPIALKLTQEISDLRNDILENRVKLNALLLKAS